MSIKYKSNKREVQNRLKRANKNMLTAVGMAGASHVKQVIQTKDLIDTGALEGSIDYAVDNDEVFVGSKLVGEVYPIYLEKETEHIKGTSYLEPGIMNNLGNLKAVAERNYKP